VALFPILAIFMIKKKNMAIYIHKFPTTGDFDKARAADYKEPWVSLTVSGSTSDYDSITVMASGTEIDLYFAGPGKSDWGWSDLHMELTITSVDLENGELTADGKIFYRDNKMTDTKYIAWNYASGETSYGGFTDMEPSVGGILHVIFSSDADKPKYGVTTSRTPSPGDFTADVGYYKGCEILSYNEGGEESGIINRVDYNKQATLTLVSGEFNWDDKQEKLIPIDVIETVFKVNVPASCEDVFDAFSNGMDLGTAAIYVDEEYVRENYVPLGDDDCETVESLFDNTNLYDVSTNMFNPNLVGHTLNISWYRIA